VAKHAEAEQVVVKALWAKPQFRLVVEDDGVGFNPRRLFHEAETHIGFLSVQERAQAIGAEFTLKSSPGKGTSAVLQLDKGGEDE
jgi:two-component system nitrate/nitrite sensor histidine kinase NarX